MAGPVQGIPSGGGITPERYYGFAGAKDKNYAGHHLAKTGYVNLFRNSSFESWSQGTSGRPDAWETNSIGTFARINTSKLRYWGQYGLKITKLSTDGAVSRIYQTIKKMPTTKASWIDDQRTFTFSVMAKTSVSDSGSMVIYFYDGTNYHYKGAYSGSGDWEELSGTFVIDPSASDMKFGIEIKEVTGVAKYFYVSAAMLVQGQAAPWFSENPLDRGIICQHWEDNGTRTEVRGAMRAIPYETSGNTTGGATSELLTTYAMTYGSRQIVHVSSNLYTYGANPEIHQTWTTNYTTTGFDLYLGRTDGRTITAGEPWIVTGVIWAIGWDVPTEQFE